MLREKRILGLIGESMQPAEFEERDLEGSLYHQLAGNCPNLWTPGQVFEGHFGIDAALFVTHPFFYQVFNIIRPMGSVVLNDYSWGYVWKTYKKKRPLPNFSVNALFQAKRPDYLQGRSSSLAMHGISGSYWRFKISGHQHRLLERLYLNLKKRIIISYVSTAFHTMDDLYDHISNNSLVPNCTFVSAWRLNEHKQWCYKCPGARGVAYSDPEPVNDLPFLEQVNQAAGNISEIENLNHRPTKFLSELSEITLRISKEETEKENPIAKIILILRDTLRDNLMEFKLSEEQRNFIYFHIFTRMTNTQWLVIGK